VVSRRLFLAGGAVALLAGCGEEDEPAAAPRPAEVLLRSLAAERALSAAASRRVAARSRERARRLASAVSEQGGRPHDAPARADGGDDAAAARAALVAHVESLPRLAGDLRELVAEMIVGAAADLAVLTREAEAFPGTPA
jgi:hypothetical protein